MNQMKLPRYENSNVIAHCPACDAITTFVSAKDGRSLGSFQNDISGSKRTTTFYADMKGPPERVIYKLVMCSTCRSGGLATILGFSENKYLLKMFYPRSASRHRIPDSVPAEIATEYREAEACFANGHRRAASAMARSTLEKTLIANGYNKKVGSLYERIEKAAEEGVLLPARSARAHNNIRVLGNDVLHEEWADLSEDDVEQSLKYTAWILNDLYDDRETVEAQLKALGRINQG